MTPDQIALLGLLISSIVTIIGWAVTAHIQLRILRETRKSQQLERELAVFRERMATVRDITSTLLEESASYHELIAMLVSGHFNFDTGANLIQQLNTKGLELAKSLYDPAFRSIRDLLPEEHAERLYNQLKKASEMGAAYHASAVGINPLTPRLDEVLRESANQALEVSKQLIKTADMFADAFAFLDKTLAKAQPPEPSIFCRVFRRLAFWKR